MTHEHTHSNRRRLAIALAIIVVFLVVEIVGAVLSGSLALLGDAGHMFSDSLGLTIALIATVIAARPANDRQTFGYQRAEVFGALINGSILAVVALAVGIEGVRRLVAEEPPEVAGTAMLVVAAAGLAANVAALLVLHDRRDSSINMRGAYLEVLGDLIGSVLAIAASIVIVTTGFTKADAAASVAIALLIAPRAFVLLRDVFRVLAQSVPADISVATIREHLGGVDGVVDVHDVHVWSITSGSPVFSAHVVVEAEVFAEGRAGAMLREFDDCLRDHFDVDHSTIQLEPIEHATHGSHQPHP
ncbi:cation diffusion facilitator family transporter [Ruicaihuangia caeni]|uniref:Cation diffusion facilitator family transporter n=1 Tax=Ruicaihuangia caeni TaxID=3042517 RepID=A0AAW6T0M4_9MICO|nr:cation diffusion facilitator family transporter [Klugiella sp. YN-L-19]MDI2097370.1 cation diffusion facilitator family transporter [Klugiella sp. YN-L-19]